MAKSPAPRSPVSRCPACRQELSSAQAASANCPHCGAPLPAGDRPSQGPDTASGNAGRATVPGIGQTIQGDDLEFVVPGAADPGGPHRGGKSTIDESPHRSTIDEGAVPPSGRPKPPPGNQTID